MKITYIHQHFRTPAEGGGQRPFQFATRLAVMGHEVTIIRGSSESTPGPTPGFSVIETDTTYRNALSMRRRLVSFADFAVRASKIAGRLETDVIFASSTPLTVALPAIVGKYRTKAPMVFEVRDLWPEVPIALGHLTNPVAIAAAHQLERAAYSQASHIIALSPTMKRGVEAVEHATPVTLIPNTSNVDAFRKSDTHRAEARARLSARPELPMLVYAGSLGASYDPSWLLDIAATGEAEVHILGVGTLHDALVSRATELGLRAADVVHGAVGHDVVVDYYAAADVVASSLIAEPSLYDNSLNKVFDAFAAGKPLIFNHPGWLADLAVAKGAGWIVDPARPRETLAILQNKPSLHDAGEASASLADEQFSTGALVSKLEAVLSDVANG